MPSQAKCLSQARVPPLAPYALRYSTRIIENCHLLQQIFKDLTGYVASWDVRPKLVVRPLGT